jgi:hypothetical protein
MAGDHEVMVRPGRDALPFHGSDFNLTPAVDACALAHEGDGSTFEPDLLGRIPEGLVPASEHLLVLLAAGVPIHLLTVPTQPSRETHGVYPGEMLFYGVVSAQTERVVEFFLAREAAEAMIGEIREDEPLLAEELRARQYGSLTESPSHWQRTSRGFLHRIVGDAT